MADESKQPAVPTRDGLDRIYRATQYVERLSRNEVPKAGRILPPLQIRYAKSTATITARSTNTLGSGPADFYHEEDAVLTADSPTLNLTVYNWSSVSIASGKWMLVAVIGGKWVVVAVDCG